jgi:membrane associated rhomboid family serine protease
VARCPRCNVRLVKRKTTNGVVYGCPKCGGKNLALTVLRKFGATRDFLNRVWQRAREHGAARMLRCPHCGRRMARVASEQAGHELSLDLCTLCRAVWFDSAELESVPKVPPPPGAEKSLSPRAREQLAVMRVRVDEEVRRERAVDVDLAPPEWWHWIPGIFGMPVEVDAPPRKSLPYVTWGIAAVVTFVVVGTVWDLESAVGQWGFVPALAYRHGGLTLLTSFFLHAGVFHLVSNMYFLLVFGDNVEEHLGRLYFVLLLFGSHLAGIMLHAVYDTNADIPLIGASAGISGVLGYYGVMFPKARLAIFIWVWVYVRWLQMPAAVLILLYLLFQFLGGIVQAFGPTGVSYLGHLGGLAVGIVVAMVVRFVRARDTARALAE